MEREFSSARISHYSPSVRNSVILSTSLAVSLGLCAPVARAFAAPAPVGAWDFDDSQQPLAATVGAPLKLRGTHEIIAGPWAGNGAVRIGIGSYYECAHGISPNGSGTMVNRYSLLVDFRIPKLGPWYCFFQTDPANKSDGDCFLRANDGAVGVGQTGYSSTPARSGVWQRLVVAVDNSAGVYRLYLDGELILRGNPQAVDGRFSLAPTLLLFADENGEDAAIDVARVAIYDVCLTAADTAELGGVTSPVAGNHAPVVLSPGTGPTLAATGEPAEFGFAATDPDQEQVRLRLDWGDASDLSGWSPLAGPGQMQTFTHTYVRAGTYEVRALAQDARGLIGTWTSVIRIPVQGEGVVRFLTAPYLQNVQTNAITIMWETDIAADAVVEYGSAGFDTTQTSGHSSSGASTEIYRCKLTNLLPGKTYRFRVRAGSALSSEGAFTTAPAGRPDFSFAVWSDSQGQNHGTYPADPLEPTKSMFRHMATNGIQLAVTTGDLAESGASYTDTHEYYLDRAAKLLGQTVPWFVAWGNHDGGAETVIRRFADLPSQNRAGYGPGYGSYSFDYAGCHFICLDNASSGTDIRTWLAQDLQSQANRQARFTFVFVHVPPFCELWVDGDQFLRDNLVPLMEAGGVDMCFSGHTHEYERGNLNGVFYCVTGGGSWLDSPEVLVREWPHITVGGYQAIPGIVKPGPTRGGGLINEYVRVDVRGDTFTASMIGFKPDGTPVGVLDQFSPPVKPPFITRLAQVPEGLRIDWTGPDGIYEVQRTAIAIDGEWKDIATTADPAQRSLVIPVPGGSSLIRLRRVP